MPSRAIMAASVWSNVMVIANVSVLKDIPVRTAKFDFQKLQMVRNFVAVGFL